MGKKYLKIDRVAVGKPICGLVDCVIGMALKYVEVAYSVLSEERTSDSAVEPVAKCLICYDDSVNCYILPHVA